MQNVYLSVICGYQSMNYFQITLHHLSCLSVNRIKHYFLYIAYLYTYTTNCIIGIKSKTKKTLSKITIITLSRGKFIQLNLNLILN